MIISYISLFLLSFCLGVCGCLTSCISSAYESELTSHTVLPGIVLGLICTILIRISNDATNGLLMLFICLAYVYFVKFFSFTKNKDDVYTIISTSGSFGISCLLINFLQSCFPQYSKLPSSVVNGSFFLIKYTGLIFHVLFFIIMQVFVILGINHLKFIACDEMFYKNMSNSITHVKKMVMIASVISIYFFILNFGIVLCAAVSIIPVVFARLMCRSFNAYIIISGLSGGIITVLSMYISLLIRSKYDIPNISYTALASCLMSVTISLGVLFGENSKIGIFRVYRKIKKKLKIVSEDVLMAMYEDKRNNSPSTLQRSIGNGYVFVILSLRLLKLKGLCDNKDSWSLTKMGKKYSNQLKQKHLMLENVLKDNLMIEHDDAHDIVDDLEHFEDDIEV